MIDPDQRLHSPGLADALAAVLAWNADDAYGLLTELAADATLVRAVGEERRLATPRLLQLLVDGDAAFEQALAIIEVVAADDWSLSDSQQINDVLDAWWLQTLRLNPGEHRPEFPPGVVLGLLAGVRPMRHWLTVWLDELDGPAGQHLADLLLGENFAADPAWEGKADEAGQVFAWARSEAVINGIALIAGPELGADVVSELLDLLI